MVSGSGSSAASRLRICRRRAVPHAVTTTAGGEANPATSAETRLSLVDVMAEWRLDTPMDALRFAREQDVCDWCLDTHRVQPGPVVASADGRRVVAFLRAPDAEAVRNAYRYATVPLDRVTALRRLDR
jgi:hypothetical protein